MCAHGSPSFRKRESLLTPLDMFLERDLLSSYSKLGTQPDKLRLQQGQPTSDRMLALWIGKRLNAEDPRPSVSCWSTVGFRSRPFHQVVNAGSRVHLISAW